MADFTSVALNRIMTNSSKTKRLDSADDLGHVYEQYKPELKGFIARQVSSMEEAEDILQDVFYNLAKIDFLENPIEYLSAWLYQAATNRIIDRRRKKKEQSLPEIRENDEDEYFMGALSNYLADDNDEPEIIFRNEVIREEIAAALAELPEEQRKIFELTEYDGISYKEIAESTGIATATLLSRKHYAVSHLRKKLRLLYLEITQKEM